ncbi:MAG: RNA polymerase sigma factor [Bacteroidetes bacterium]|nr:RNA polymerase sigma factor [Fibrella sp.]
MTERSVEELIEGCRRKNEAAHKAFYERYYAYALTVCLAYASNREDAAELLNDGFMKVFRSLNDLKSVDTLLPWLRRIMVNTALDHYRKNRVRFADVSIDQVENQLVEPNVGDEAVYASLSAEEIINALQELATPYRVVFSLYVLDGYSHREIAAQLSIAESTSRAHLSEANRLLRRRLADQTTKRYDRTQ